MTTLVNTATREVLKTFRARPRRIDLPGKVVFPGDAADLGDDLALLPEVDEPDVGTPDFFSEREDTREIDWENLRVVRRRVWRNRPLANAKHLFRRVIKDKRDRVASGIIQIGGTQVKLDIEFRTQVREYLDEAREDPTATFEIDVSDNGVKTVTAAQVLQVARKVQQHTKATNANFKILLDLVINANTVDELRTIDVEVGWPLTVEET